MDDCPNCEYHRQRAQLWRDEAYKQAGHPLPEQDGECKHCTDGCPACDARKLPEQEPVAWAKFSAKGNIIDLLSEPDDDYTPLYTTPPQRKPLTDEDKDFIVKRASVYDWHDYEVIEATEANLKEKNA
jgi:hypothetical protein